MTLEYFLIQNETSNNKTRQKLEFQLNLWIKELKQLMRSKVKAKIKILDVIKRYTSNMSLI